MDIKKYLKNYSLKKLRCLVDVLIGVLNDPTEIKYDTMSFGIDLLLKNQEDVVELDVK